MTKKKKDNEALISVLAYFLVGIIWYLADDKAKNDVTKHHVKQALNLFILSFALNAILTMIIFIGWLLIPIFNVAFLILWIIGLINAINGNKKNIPLIGKFAKKYLTF